MSKIKIVRVKVEILQFILRPEWNDIEIILGESFRLFENKIYINETPYQDATLVPITNIVINSERYFEFDSFFKNKHTHFIIDLSTHSMAIEIAKLIREINEKGFEVDLNYKDQIKIKIEEDDVKIRIEKSEKEQSTIEELAIFAYNKYGNIFTMRFPEPMRQYAIQRCDIRTENNIYVKCDNSNICEENKQIEKYEFQLELTIQPNLLDLVKSLLESCFDKYNKLERI